MSLSTGLLHRYDCNQAAGNLVDSVGALSMAGTTTLLPTPGFVVPTQGNGRNHASLPGDYAIFGQDKHANGTGDGFAYVADAASVRFVLGTPISVGFWFNPSDDGAGNTASHYLVADESLTWSGSPSFEGAWGFRWEKNAGTGHYEVALEIVHGTWLTTVLTVDMGTVGFFGAWHTVILTYDGTTFSLTVDCGSAVTTTQDPTHDATTRQLYLTIGGRYITNPTAGPGQGANALIDEVNFWDHVLSGADQAAFCAGQLPVSNAGLLVYFAGAMNGDVIANIDYGAPTVFTLPNPSVGIEYVLEAPAADLAGFASGRMGNVKFRRAGSSGSYSGSIILRGIEIVYDEQ